jgi:hypothetical protein
MKKPSYTLVTIYTPGVDEPAVEKHYGSFNVLAHVAYVYDCYAYKLTHKKNVDGSDEYNVVDSRNDREVARVIVTEVQFT